MMGTKSAKGVRLKIILAKAFSESNYSHPYRNA